jgi:hypothetical protein
MVTQPSLDHLAGLYAAISDTEPVPARLAAVELRARMNLLLDPMGDVDGSRRLYNDFCLVRIARALINLAQRDFEAKGSDLAEVEGAYVLSNADDSTQSD